MTVLLLTVLLLTERQLTLRAATMSAESVRQRLIDSPGRSAAARPRDSTRRQELSRSASEQRPRREVEVPFLILVVAMSPQSMKVFRSRSRLDEPAARLLRRAALDHRAELRRAEPSPTDLPKRTGHCPPLSCGRTKRLTYATRDLCSDSFFNRLGWQRPVASAVPANGLLAG